MKKNSNRLICLALLICLIFSLALNVCATSAPEATVTRNGINYKLGEDMEHYEVLGAAFDSNSFTVLSQIDGIPVTEIKESAFQNNTYINKITIPDTVTSIGKAAFRNCKNLTEVVLSNNTTSLPAECFYDCGMLTKITLPTKLAYIGDDCFKNCKLLGSLKIPASVTEIGHDAFLNCEQLILNVSDNAYAADYAKQENVNTDFKNSSAYFLILVLICIAVSAVIIIAVSIPLKKHFKKHPNHDPVVYIEKFFGAIGRILSFICNKIKLAVIFVVSKIIAFIEVIGKKTIQRRTRNLEESKEADISEENSNEQ